MPGDRRGSIARGLAPLVLVVAALGAAAGAYRPVFVDDAGVRVIDDLEKSATYYGELSPGETDSYRIEAEGGQEVSLEILVPKRDELGDFRPRLTISNDGTEEIVPANTGPASHYDGLTQTYYWSYGSDETRIVFERTGDYTLAVTVDRGPGGPYAIETSGAAGITVRDALLFPLDWVRVHLWYFS